MPKNRLLHGICAAAGAALLAATILLTGSGTAQAALPTPIAASTARTYLSEMTATPETQASTYDRDLFPTWITISGTCDTREYVIKRDGSNVVTDSSCKATSGNRTSPYDGVTTTNPSTFDIDHLVSAPASNHAPGTAVHIVSDIPLTNAAAPPIGRTSAPDTATNLPAETRGL
ncbi:hypothetical protein SAMN05216223_101717 [Actinacidiphila yanglinensis]|uniref:DUF1524 domain-containing protein n=1 Tax=Actinacidiphila yanglinensis TaxID=310779 RepID=A0A1H5U035_9ACTN|nr:hypothetical protein [Actinacidiphila yanglinensis]SEF68369.1 hypothetical protein SAMN05216223_101717 [Actinacidiphila yanglinensis]